MSMTQQNAQLETSENLVIKKEKSVFITEKKPVLDKFGRAYATGRRKVAAARVWIKPGTGKIFINKKEVSEFFKDDALIANLKSPLIKTKSLDSFDVYATVKGGGISGQSGALRHGIARALDNYNPAIYHNILKENKFE